MRYQLATESESSSKSTLIPTPSSCARKCENPRPVSIRSISLEYKVERLQCNSPCRLTIADRGGAAPCLNRRHSRLVETFETATINYVRYADVSFLIQFPSQHQLSFLTQPFRKSRVGRRA